MKISKKQYAFTGIGIIIFFLILTNPSQNSFKDYLGTNSYYGLQRKKNFFILSEYQYADEQNYIGVAGNFFRIGQEPKDTIIKYDTVKTGGLLDTSQVYSPTQRPQDKLRKLYDLMRDNPTIKGIPKDYDIFLKKIVDTNASRVLYDSLRTNKTIVGIPISYNVFLKSLGLNRK